MYWVGPDGGVGTTSWNGQWAQPFGIAPPGSAVPGAITAISRNPDQMDVYWVGPDGGVGTTSWNGQWAQPFGIAPPGSAVPGAITAISRNPDQMDVYWVGPDGGVGTTSWNGQWAQPFGIAPPGSAVPGAITAISRNPDQMDVYWVGPDGGVGTTWWRRGKKIYLHFKMLAAPSSFSVPIPQMVAAMRETFMAIDIDLVVLSEQTLNLPLLIDLDVGKCLMGTVTEEQRELFTHRDNADERDIVVYFIKADQPSVGRLRCPSERAPWRRRGKHGNALDLGARDWSRPGLGPCTDPEPTHGREHLSDHRLPARFVRRGTRRHLRQRPNSRGVKLCQRP